MTLHTLVHSCDSFSCNCNSIHSFVSIVFHCDLRAFSSFLFLLLRVYINYRDSSTSHFTSSIYSNVTTSTRNKFFKCTYVHLCLFHSKLPHWFQCVPIYIGLLANNATPRNQVHPRPGRYSPEKQTLAYGKREGGTHPIGMHSF